MHENWNAPHCSNRQLKNYLRGTMLTSAFGQFQEAPGIFRLESMVVQD